MSQDGSIAAPHGWVVAKLESIVLINYGKALSATTRAQDGTVPVVGSSGIVGQHNQSLIDGACLVVGRKGAAGSVHLISQSSWPIDTAYFIQPPRGINLSYLYYFLSSQELGRLDKSTAIPSLSRDDLYAVEAPIAPEAEQTRIVEKLEELLSDLDAGVAELKAAQRKLAQYRQSLLKAAVEGALTADWRAARARSGEPQESGADLLQRILTERRARWEAKQTAKYAEQGKTPPKGWQAKYSEPLAPDTSALSALPEGWSWASIDQIAGVGTGVTPLRSNRTYFEGGTIPWTTSGALNDEFVTEASEYVTASAMAACRLELFPAGSLLVAMYGEGRTRGKCAELTFPSTINQAIAAVVLDDTAEKLRPFVKAFFWNAYEAMRKQASGGVQPNLNLQIIKSLAIPTPPIDEQAIVEARLTEQLEHYDHLGVAIEVGLHQAAAQRKNILKAAFAGQLVPQDPHDEPASALLERIRAEREAAGPASTRKRGRKAKENG